jgi:tRNA dimethylallyltransferase
MQEPLQIAIGLVDQHLATAKHPLIVVLGPTAGGKTALSVDLALAIREKHAGGWDDAEIVNSDSRQVYKHLDIGTAKATLEERRGVRHHLFDELDPREDVTAAWYQKRALTVLDNILSRGTVPLLVGGSMLYVSAVIDGLSFAGKSDPLTRERLSQEYDYDEGRSLQARLRTLDPEAADRTERRNKVYMLRAMEIAEMAGTVRHAKTKTVSPYDVLMIGLRWPREVIKERIEKRTRSLLEHGWIDEVKELLQKGYGPRDPGMISHGYREIMEWIPSKGSMSELAKTISRNTARYAKRQMTWWGKDERIQWIEMA